MVDRLPFEEKARLVQTDIIVHGELQNKKVYVAIEVSVSGKTNDIERALKTAQILESFGLNATALVVYWKTGKKFTNKAQQEGVYAIRCGYNT